MEREHPALSEKPVCRFCGKHDISYMAELTPPHSCILQECKRRGQFADGFAYDLRHWRSVSRLLIEP